MRGYFKNTGFILSLICLFALLIRVLFFIALEPWDEQIVRDKVLAGDSNGYHRLASSIITTYSFSQFFGSFRTPAYPLFLAFIYSLFGVKPWIVLLLQLFMDTGIVIIVYFIAKEIFNSKQISLIAAFLYSINFLSAYYSIRLLTEIPFTLIFAVGILIFIRALKKNEIRGFVSAGFFIGLATLIRPITQYFPLVLLIVLALCNRTFIHKLRNMLILLIVFFIVISAWQFRNLRTYGHYSLSFEMGAVLCRWYAGITKAGTEKISIYEAQKELVGDSLKGVTNPFEQSRIYKKIALSYISKHPLQYMKYHLKGAFKIFMGTARSGISDLLGIKTKPYHAEEPFSETVCRIIKNFYNELHILILVMKQMLEYIFLIIGLVAMRRKDKKLFFLLFIMIILYFVALTGPVGYSRFRVPMTPFYLIISAAGILETFKFIKNGKRSVAPLP